ncbi:MAG: hypothetical protein ACLFWD_00220 [Anaerolineales bacterium]
MADDFEVGEPLPEESSNRTFLLVAGGLGGLLVLSMICLGVYALVIAPAQQERALQQPTEIALQNTETALELTEAAAAADATDTPVATDTPQPTDTPAPTDTPTPTEVVVLPTETPFTTLSTLEPQTATAAAQATADAMTPSATPTALPATGFADEAGLPALLLMAAALVAIVVVARRLRGATA